MSIDRMNEAIRASDKYVNSDEEYFFTWNKQKELLLKFSWEMVKEFDQNPSEAIATAKEFLDTFHSEVLNFKTKIYYIDRK